MEATIICCSGQPAGVTVSTGRNSSLEGARNKLLEKATKTKYWANRTHQQPRHARSSLGPRSRPHVSLKTCLPGCTKFSFLIELNHGTSFIVSPAFLQLGKTEIINKCIPGSLSVAFCLLDCSLGLDNQEGWRFLVLNSHRKLNRDRLAALPGTSTLHSRGNHAVCGSNSDRHRGWLGNRTGHGPALRG